MSLSFYLVPAAFLVLLALERAFPLRRPTSRWQSRLRVNMALSMLAIAVALAVVRPVAIACLAFATEHEWGLARVASGNVVVQAVVAFLLMDLTFYYWHRANHAWPWLWRFHNVHHVDPDLDVSTAVRFHFAEIAWSAAFRALQVTLIGGPAWVFLAYEVAFQLNTLFHHSNVRLPIAVERMLSLVVVTPRMHGIHHSERYREANSNWSSVFSWWDRLHGTLRLNVPQASIDIGIAGYSLAGDNAVGALTRMPFERQREYWRDADTLGAPVRRQREQTVLLE